MKELSELDVAKDNAWRNLVRIAGETKASITQLLLKKVGLAAHDLRLQTDNSSFPMEIETIWQENSGLLDERYWRVPVRPAKLRSAVSAKRSQ